MIDAAADSIPDASDAASPQSVYQARRALRVNARQRLEAIDERLSTTRGIVFISALILAWFVLMDGSVSALWMPVPVVVFVGLMIGHSRVARRLQLAKQAVAYYDRCLARLDGKWSGVGVSGDRYLCGEHPYSGDLDIFGEGSLFQLICSVRTRLAEDTLARWLSNGASVQTIRERQQAIEEFREQVDFREELALLDAEVHDEIDQNGLLNWVETEPRPVSLRDRIASTVLGFCAAIGVVLWTLGFGLSPLLAVLLVEVLYFSTLVRNVQRLSAEADEAGSGLAILAQVLRLIEKHEFRTPFLRNLRATLETDGHPPSRQIKKLQGHIQSLNNCLANQFFAPLAFMFGVPVHVVHRIEKWREQIGPHIPEWLDAVGQIEALCSLSGYSFENPSDPFPQLVEEAEGPCFEAAGLGHPLIVSESCVRNDVSLNRQLRLLMVSGSNMSGKSTLLRTIGINTVLALCGAPVRAKQLTVSPLVIGTAMRVNDSLQQGASLFYSVISRIKSVVEQAGGSPPLLFLLDEILQGTNSHDRRVGAEGIIRQLVNRGAIGLVTTHDLALTSIVESFGEASRNIHFEDHILDGKMLFDYHIRSGVVAKSNALELMRMVGLDVGDGAEPAEVDVDG